MLQKDKKSSLHVLVLFFQGNFKIKAAKLRGEESNGMICSLQELAIEGKLVPKAYAEGIYVLT